MPFLQMMIGEKIHWHDNAIHGLRILEGADECMGELVLDIDFIVEWLKTGVENLSWQIAPADLTFHEVSDLIVTIDYAVGSAALQPMMIHEIHRDTFNSPTGHSSFIWKIEMNWPANSAISFRSTGFTQVLRGEPVISENQWLMPSERT